MSCCISAVESLESRLASYLANSEALTSWHVLVRKLGLADYDMEAIRADFPRAVKDRCREAIILWWKQATGLSASEKLDMVIEKLKEEKLNIVAGKIYFIP